MKLKKIITSAAILLLFLNGCGQNGESNNGNFEETSIDSSFNYESELDSNDSSNSNSNEEIEYEEIFEKELVDYRKIFLSEDNNGYNSTNTASLSFEPLTNLYVKTSTEDDFSLIDEAGNIPIVAVNKSTNFDLQIYFDSKKENDVLYSWDTSEREEDSIISKKYSISSDTWGEVQEGKNKQNVTVNGQEITTGKIGTGALIVQTSSDAINWNNNDMDKYSNGLYTTDVLNHYNGTKQSFLLNGDEIKKGVYVSISFLYEVQYEYTHYYTTEERYWYQLGFIGKTHTVTHYDEKTTFLNICETYMIFVVEDNPNVITFNNLTVSDNNEIIEVTKPSIENDENYAVQEEQYNNYVNSVVNQITSTMKNNDMTTTGLRINITSNPYLKIEVKKDGFDFQLPQVENKNGQMYYEILENGKYDITISSFSKKKQLTIYVDNYESSKVYQRYFGKEIINNGKKYGDNFLDYSPNNPYGNKRIFDIYSDVPVFLNKITLNLQALQNNNVLPLKGKITNKSTGEVIDFNNLKMTLDKEGLYEILFYTNEMYYEYAVLNHNEEKLSGDVRVYKFNFKIVGKQSNESINKHLITNKSFEDYSIMSPSDYYPSFYGVARSSSNKGKIIVAFFEREEALKYAKSVAWGEIETHKDVNGKTYWLVPNLENLSGAKIESHSGWNNANIVNELAQRMVEEHYFDLTKTSSYLTLEKSYEEIIENGNSLENLQFVELKKTIVVWYNNEQRSLAIIKETQNNGVDISKYISKQNTAVLSKDDKGIYSIINESIMDYKFIKDSLGIDSFEIEAIDIYGNKYSLNYDEGLYSQLTKLNVPSGNVSIMEKNIYGDVTANYTICYIKEGYQPAVVTIVADGNKIELSSSTSVQTNIYKEVNIESITNSLDPYTFIRIKYESNQITNINYYFSIDFNNHNLTEKGNYEITVIDRFGNNFSYAFTIN